MALQVKYSKRTHGVSLKSGQLYIFNYIPFEHDPIPTYLHMYVITGTHPNTGKSWNLMEGINMTYLPRQMRKQFAKEWVEQVSGSRNLRFTYEKMKARYPWMKIAIRRYLLSPKRYVSKIRQIPLENMEQVIVGSWSKDFSKRALISLVSRYRRGARFIAGRALKSIFGGRV